METAITTSESRARDGVVLANRVWTPAGPVRGRVRIVHGLKDHSARYDAFASLLAREGFTVVATDLRGHGRSGGDRQFVRRFDDWVDDLETVGQEDRESRPRSSFVFAHSLGGAVALAWVLRRRPDLTGLVLSGAALEPPAGTGRGAATAVRLLGAVVPHLGVLRLPPSDFSRDAETVRALELDLLVSPAPVPARTAAELLWAMRQARPRWNELRLPLLAVHGTEDRLTLPKGSERLVRAAASSDKEHRSYPGLYHDLLHEPERDVVAGDILRWLVDRDPGASRS